MWPRDHLQCASNCLTELASPRRGRLAEFLTCLTELASPRREGGQLNLLGFWMLTREEQPRGSLIRKGFSRDYIWFWQQSTLWGRTEVQYLITWTATIDFNDTTINPLGRPRDAAGVILFYFIAELQRALWMFGTVQDKSLEHPSSVTEIKYKI